MHLIILVPLMLFQIAVLASIAASITAAVTRGGMPPLRYWLAFKAALMPWVVAFSAISLTYFVFSLNGSNPSEVPSLLLLGILVVGGWFSAQAVKGKKLQMGVTNSPM